MNIPDKVIEFKGQKVNLYSKKKVSNILGCSHVGLRLLEKSGRLPDAMFTGLNNRKFYSEQEVQAVRQAVAMFGRSRSFSNPDSVRLFEHIAKSWKAIREALLCGKAPPVTVHLRFETEEEYHLFFRNALREAGIVSEQYLKAFTERLLAYRSFD